MKEIVLGSQASDSATVKIVQKEIQGTDNFTIKDCSTKRMRGLAMLEFNVALNLNCLCILNLTDLREQLCNAEKFNQRLKEASD